MPSKLSSGFYSGNDLKEIYSERFSPGVSLSEIKAKWDREGSEVPFIACGVDQPDYVSMTTEESAYYFYWRSMVRRGKYLRSSEGYLFLFTAEIINMDADAERNLRMLVNVTRVYANMDPFLLDGMADACITYAKINGLPVPRMERAGDFSVASYLLTESLRADPISPISSRVAGRLLYATDQQYMDRDHPYGDLFTESLRRIEEHERRHGGKRVVDSLGPLRRIQYDVYKQFPYLGTRSRVAVECLDLSHGSQARDFLRVTLKTLIRAVRVRDGLTAPLPVNYPATWRLIIGDTVRDWAYGRWRTEELTEGSLQLDMSSIKAARHDLNAVSDMMAIEEEAADTEDKEDVPASEDDDPWKTLSSVLDDGQKEYLSAAMEGRAAAYLRAAGRRMSAVEEAINSAAMDAVGDIVVEDGRIIEEYDQEIRGVLGWTRRTYREGHW